MYLAITWGNISLSVSFVLSNLYTVDVRVLKYTLVHNHKLAIKARVDLQVLRSLYANRLEKLIVERIDHNLQVSRVRNICIIFYEDLFLVISDKPAAIDPEQAGVNG